MKLKELHIKNMQSHKDTILKFHPNVNVITGESNSGKSAIFRAFRLIWENRPISEKIYKSWWGGITSVKLTTDDGHSIERRRGGSNENCYIIDGDEKNPYTGFGKGVPDIVSKILNMTSLNYQKQLELPFLISDTAGEAAKKLNQAVKLDDIDRVLSNINSKSRETNSAFSEVETEYAKLATTLQDLRFVIDADTILQQLEIDEGVIDALAENCTSLEELILQIELEQDAASSAKELIESLEQTDLFKRYEIISKESSKISRLQEIIEIFDSSLECIDAEAIEASFKKLYKMYKETLSQAKEEESLRNLITSFMNYELQIDTYNKDIKIKEDKFKKEFPDICPLCKQKRRMQ